MADPTPKPIEEMTTREVIQMIRDGKKRLEENGAANREPWEQQPGEDLSLYLVRLRMNAGYWASGPYRMQPDRESMPDEVAAILSPGVIVVGPKRP
jgi:hypothetical protein